MEHTEIRVTLVAGEVKMRLRSGERAPRSGPNDPVNRGAIASPDRCTANKKASARSPTPLRNPKGESAYVASPRGSCRAATTTIDIVHRYISSYRPLSFSVPDSTSRGSKQSRGPSCARGPRRRNAGQSIENASLSKHERLLVFFSARARAQPLS